MASRKAALQDGVNQIDLSALDAQLQALDTEIGNLEALVAGGDLPDAPGAPPGGPPPADTGGGGDDTLLPGESTMLGGYVIPAKKRASKARVSSMRKSSTRKSTMRRSKGGKKSKSKKNNGKK